MQRAITVTILVLSAVLLCTAADNRTSIGGTLVLAKYTTDFIVIAADSRVSRLGGGAGFTDDGCKLIAIGPDGVFAHAGRAGLLRDQTVVWHAMSSAAAIAPRARNAGGDWVQSAAEKWAENAKAFFEAATQKNQKWVVGGLKTRNVTTGLFAGCVNGSELRMVVAYVDHDGGRADGVTFSVFLDLKTPSDDLVGMGVESTSRTVRAVSGFITGRSDAGAMWLRSLLAGC